MTPPDPVVGERWLPVIGFESLYEVSDHGRVRSLGRIDSLGRHRRGRVIRGGRDGEGYHNVSLTPLAINSIAVPSRSFRDHHLVLTAFVKPRPPGMEACHNDGYPSHNHLTNLRWDTRSSNRRDAASHGTNLTGRQLRPRDTGNSHAARALQSGACCRGHLLAAPNLTASHTGRRRCLACQRGHNTVRDAAKRGIRLDLNTEANRHYAHLMIPTPRQQLTITSDVPATQTT